jgi:UPF0176 protein
VQWRHRWRNQRPPLPARRLRPLLALARGALPTIAAVPNVHVVAAYQFVDIDDAPALLGRLQPLAAGLGLKGTVLLAPEGINLSLAGTPQAVSDWLDVLRADARFATIEVKTHLAQGVPFGRLRFKIKREIIRMNELGVRPQAGRAPAVDATTLQRWLDAGQCDAGRPVVMLDTRNAFEVDAGRFAGALDWRLARFSDFPAALQAHRDELQDKTVVSYCTGGIRCEKAALWLAQVGVPNVLQLDGGILRYFELAAGAPHWQGECVVFDERGALDPALQSPAPAPAPAAAQVCPP